MLQYLAFLVFFACNTSMTGQYGISSTEQSAADLEPADPNVQIELSMLSLISKGETVSVQMKAEGVTAGQKLLLERGSVGASTFTKVGEQDISGKKLNKSVSVEFATAGEFAMRARVDGTMTRSEILEVEVSDELIMRFDSAASSMVSVQNGQSFAVAVDVMEEGEGVSDIEVTLEMVDADGDDISQMLERAGNAGSQTATTSAEGKASFKGISLSGSDLPEEVELVAVATVGEEKFSASLTLEIEESDDCTLLSMDGEHQHCYYGDKEIREGIHGVDHRQGYPCSTDPETMPKQEHVGVIDIEFSCDVASGTMTLTEISMQEGTGDFSFESSAAKRNFAVSIGQYAGAANQFSSRCYDADLQVTDAQGDEYQLEGQVGNCQ